MMNIIIAIAISNESRLFCHLVLGKNFILAFNAANQPGAFSSAALALLGQFLFF
jgi:hypothetical protein